MNKNIICLAVLLILLTVSFSNNIFAEDVSYVVSWDKNSVKLYQPLFIDAIMYRDGGTLSVSIKDKFSSELLLSLDGRMGTWHRGGGRYGFLYIGVAYPGLPGAYEVVYGGKEEKEILKILNDWFNAQVPQAKRELIASHAGSPDTFAIPKGDERYYYIFAVVRELKRRNP